MMMIKIQANSWCIPILLILGTLIFPLIVAYHHIGDRIIFNFLAADSMYYMSIANNYTKYGFPTMDGVAATNGFHPLWEYILMLLFKYTGISHHNQIYLVFGLSIALVCITYAIFSHLLIQLGGKWPGIIATLFLIPGMYSLF